MADNNVGAWAFVIGLILAIVIAIFGINQAWPIYLLAILGIVVGLLNITDREVLPFLVAAIAFLLTFATLSAIVNPIPGVGSSFANFFSLMNVFVAPAAAVVAFKALFSHTRR
jgi:hypothetical protein